MGKTGTLHMTKAMEQAIDEKIRKKVQESRIDIPVCYKQSIENVLDLLMYDWKYRRRIKIRKLAFAASFALVFMGIMSTGIYATINYVDRRMESMNIFQIAEYNSDVQNADAEFDTYSREFSEEEVVRIEKLNIAYQSKGLYPESELLQIKDENADVISDGDILAFSTNRSMFYLPEREMTDEEILELIDFYYKRDFSITYLNKGIADNTKKNAESLQASISEKDALEKAVNVAEEVFGLDVSRLEYKADIFDSENEKVCTISFKEEGQNICDIIMNMNNGMITEALDLSIKVNDDIQVELIKKEDAEVIYQTKVKKMNQILFSKQNEKNVYVRYIENTDSNTIENGNITYLVEMDDGAGCRYGYDCRSECIDSFYYLPDFDENDNDLKSDENLFGEQNIIKRVIQLFE